MVVALRTAVKINSWQTGIQTLLGGSPGDRGAVGSWALSRATQPVVSGYLQVVDIGQRSRQLQAGKGQQ